MGIAIDSLVNWLRPKPNPLSAGGDLSAAARAAASSIIVVPVVDGAGPPTGRVVRWLKEEGAAVRGGEPVVDFEIEKIRVEWPAESNGILRQRVPTGKSIVTGEEIGWIADPRREKSIVAMPAMGDGARTATLLRWRLRDGDAARSGDVVAEFETDKSHVELEASVSGVLRIRAAEGQTVQVGDLLAIIDDPETL